MLDNDNILTAKASDGPEGPYRRKRLSQMLLVCYTVDSL